MVLEELSKVRLIYTKDEQSIITFSYEHLTNVKTTSLKMINQWELSPRSCERLVDIKTTSSQNRFTSDILRMNELNLSFLFLTINMSFMNRLRESYESELTICIHRI